MELTHGKIAVFIGHIEVNTSMLAIPSPVQGGSQPHSLEVGEGWGRAQEPIKVSAGSHPSSQTATRVPDADVSYPNMYVRQSTVNLRNIICIKFFFFSLMTFLKCLLGPGRSGKHRRFRNQ